MRTAHDSEICIDVIESRKFIKLHSTAVQIYILLLGYKEDGRIIDDYSDFKDMFTERRYTRAVNKLIEAGFLEKRDNCFIESDNWKN